MRVNSYVRLGLSYLGVKRVWSSPDFSGSCLQGSLHLVVLWVSITWGALLSGPLSPAVSAEFHRCLNLVTLYIRRPSPVYFTRDLASSVSLASLILGSEPLKLCAGIGALILLMFCGGGQ